MPLQSLLVYELARLFAFLSLTIFERTTRLAECQFLTTNHPASNVGDDKCNGAGVCKGRNMCANVKIKCSAKDTCHTVGTCFSGTGRCTNPRKKAGTKCDDKNKNTGVSAYRHFFTFACLFVSLFWSKIDLGLYAITQRDYAVSQW